PSCLANHEPARTRLRFRALIIPDGGTAMMRSTALITMGLVGTAAMVSYALRHRPQAKAATTAPPAPVRDAGPEHMDNPPRRWDPIDQQADESFPASDPPGNY